MRNAKLQISHAESQRNSSQRSGWLIAAAALVGATAVRVYYQRVRRERMSRPTDSAPPRTAKAIVRRDQDRAVTGKTVTIDRPRAEVYRFWRDFSNLPSFMENIIAIEPLAEGRYHWSIRGPAGTTIDLISSLIEEQENERLCWHSVENSDIEAHGSVTFRDAPGGRGTEVEAIVSYKPPGGEVGRWVAKLFQREPALQGRRELKRLKMLLETGEVATAKNHGCADAEKATNEPESQPLPFETQRYAGEA